MGFYEKLKNCTTREEVRASFFEETGLVFPLKQKFDSTEQVLYIFRKERRFLPPKGIASPLAQALYVLRELKYGGAALSAAAVRVLRVPRGGLYRSHAALRAVLRPPKGRKIRLGPHTPFALS